MRRNVGGTKQIKKKQQIKLVQIHLGFEICTQCRVLRTCPFNTTTKKQTNTKNFFLTIPMIQTDEGIVKLIRNSNKENKSIPN